MEGDEALFCGRDLEIRDGLKALEELRETITQRALVIQAPSGAGSLRSCALVCGRDCVITPALRRSASSGPRKASCTTWTGVS